MEQTVRLSENGLAFIKRQEGVRLTAYPDAVGVWTIGYGHTGGVLPGQTITEEWATELLRRDVERFERAVSRAVTVSMSQNEFDAMVSLAFNIGEANFARSSVLRKLNQGDRSAAAASFALWNKAGGRVLPGLTRRRALEAAMFRGGPANPRPLAQSRTLSGGAVAAGGSAALMSDDVRTAISGLSWGPQIVAAVILLGALWAVYARWDDAGRPVPSWIPDWLARLIGARKPLKGAAP